LAAAVADPVRPLSDLPALEDAERAQLLGEWIDTAAPIPDRCAHELFEDWADRTPEAPALVDTDGAVWTYGELEEKANRLARHLQAAGVGLETPVALFLPRSPELVLAMLATQKAGGFWVPIDPSHPDERTRRMLADSGARVVVTRESLEEVGPSSTARVASGVSPDNVAYGLFTSGSTGRPKGVLVEHRGLWNLTLGFIELLALAPGERLLMVPSLAFDASAGNLFPVLAAGATLVLHPDPGGLGPDDLVRFCEERAVSVIDMPAALWAQWLEALDGRAPGPLLPCLRQIVVGGESIAVERVARWARLTAGRVTVMGPYGPTEASVCTTSWCTVDGADCRPGAVVLPIGRPLPNTRVRLVGRRGELVPLGAPGELMIGGTGVSRGYLDRPAATARAFLPEPGAPTPGARLYATGDLARFLPDGSLEFLGRADGQVKVRGFRIELGEIETALLAHPAVRQAAVVAPAGPGTARRLVAYVVAAAEDQPPAPAELRAFLAESLPDYMVPARFVALERLPLTATGKLDRRALPAPSEEAGGAEPSAPPARGAEQDLAAIIARVLGRAAVGRDDNFFELGGDSILSLQVVAQAQAAGYRLTPRDLFLNQTAAELARVAVAEPGEGGPPAVVAEQGPVTGALPLLPIQRWFFEQRPADLHHWNQALLFVPAEPLEAEALAVALGALVSHHDALRLRFEETAQGWQQEALPPEGLSVPLVRVDLAPLDEADRGAAILALTEDLQSGFDLGSPPLMRAALFELGPGEAGRLFLACHHLVVDGVSWRILLEDLERAYRQAVAGRQVALPAKTTSVKTWAERLSELAAGEELAAEIPHWLEVAGAAARPLPLDGPGGENTVASAEAVRRQLSGPALAAWLGELPRSLGTTLEGGLLAALAVALGEWVGGAVRVDLEGHGREPLFPDVDLSRTVGWLTAVHPVLLPPGPAREPRQILEEVAQRRRALPRGGLGFALLCARATASGEAASLLAMSAPEVVFNYLGRLDGAAGEGLWLAPASETVGPQQSPRARRSHLLEVTASVGAGQLHLELKFSRHRHRRATIEGLAERILRVLEQLAGTPDDEEMERIARLLMEADELLS
ncbi:MAG TPA: amino acid adenylation domain-containing protein, partial [Thermoanaerobaculia bacterium]|nr:amino acid adenylation domain-containing protein [Thermoanaerobaculia bacterium]